MTEATDRDLAYSYFLANRHQVECWQQNKEARQRYEAMIKDKPKHCCPRRWDTGMSEVSAYPAEDCYRDDGTCTYCGSPSGDDIMSAIEAGVEVGPTDKGYKIYLHGGRFPKAYLNHLTIEQRLRFVELLNAGKIKIGMPGHFYVLPFFIKRPTLPPTAVAEWPIQ